MTSPGDFVGPRGTMAVLMASVFTVTTGFGVALPLLPDLIELRLGAYASVTQVSRSTGLLTAIYMLSIFMSAPLWGRLSDRYGRRTILVVGLTGFGVSMIAFALIETLPAVYAERFFSGMFAAAVTPVALAATGDITASDEKRARRLTLVSLAGVTGLLVGPMLGVLIAQVATSVVPAGNITSPLTFPMAMTAIWAFVMAAFASKILRHSKQAGPSSKLKQVQTDSSRWIIPQILALAFIVSAAVGVFEVGLALRGRQQFGLTPYEVALMFTECSLVMITVQAVIFSPWIKPATTRWFIAPSLAVLAIGLLMVPRADNFLMIFFVVGAIAASAGILSPIFTYWISSSAGTAQGKQLGKQTAAASLGAATGSAAGGIFFNVTWLPDASFVLIAALTVIGLLLSLGLPKMLMKSKHDNAVAAQQTHLATA